MITQMTGFKNKLLAPYNGLKVTWFDGWHPTLGEALQQLPEMETCPHELFRLLLQNPESAPKKTALVTKHGIPVAVIPLRQLGRWYYEIATWMIPGAVFPTQPGYLASALEALGSEVWVTWRRMGGPPPPSPLIRYMKTTPVYMLKCSSDFESYWRETGHFKNVRKTRNRCKDFSVAINLPESAEWIIRNAAIKWNDDPTKTSRVDEDWVINDWIMTAKYWEGRGRHFAILLLDQGSPICGATLMVHNNDVIGGMIYRKPEYEWHGVGARLLDLSASFAAERGFENLDFGGGADYKKSWAPQVGELWHYSLCPEPLFRAKQALNSARTVRQKLSNSVRDNQG